jgi:hypothetical protein
MKQGCQIILYWFSCNPFLEAGMVFSPFFADKSGGGFLIYLACPPLRNISKRMQNTIILPPLPPLLTKTQMGI